MNPTTTNEKNTATLLHLSTFSQYIIPLGNFILPIIIWSSKKEESEYINKNGKNAINFQLSIFLYTIILFLVSIPIILYFFLKNTSIKTFDSGSEFIIENLRSNNGAGIIILSLVVLLLFCIIKAVEFVLVIYASVKASHGEAYKYPLTINFIK